MKKCGNINKFQNARQLVKSATFMAKARSFHSCVNPNSKRINMLVGWLFKA